MAISFSDVFYLVYFLRSPDCDIILNKETHPEAEDVHIEIEPRFINKELFIGVCLLSPNKPFLYMNKNKVFIFVLQLFVFLYLLMCIFRSRYCTRTRNSSTMVFWRLVECRLDFIARTLRCPQTTFVGCLVCTHLIMPR